ncbi:outer membrane beta-barrel protein [Helicobacter sp. 11S03491-1]|uniref:outer membrane beta-barrel protein n=1 Tax=Helicobacter sp. 11S03491-1 TaxID=1476196 RepID=UPI000BD18057|nr:outer membrane beta-barrel protein [Helicobacter sp. 11S03491-1]PAF41237.1 hypothetical protein BKH45_07695 [Helicobacter sp. 11S03491-1]
MKILKQLLIIVVFGFGNLLGGQSLKLFLGVDTRGTDSIYDSKYYKKGVGIEDERRYGYEGFIGSKFGVEYFFNQKNGLRAFVGLGYANIKLLNRSNRFDSYSGVGTRVGLHYLLNYYSDDRFDFGFFGGVDYFNNYYKRKDENIVANQVLGILGLNMTIDSKHRLEIGTGIPFFSIGRYNSLKYKNIPITRQFNNLYYGISYIFLFNL